MAAPTVCSITGLIRDAGGNPITGATVQITYLKPFIHPTDNSLVADYISSTTTATDGTFSLSAVESTTPAVTGTLSIIYPYGSGLNNSRKDYTVMVPNAASATLASLISGEL